MRPSPAIEALRTRIRQIEAPARNGASVLPFRVPALDARLPGGGLAGGVLHEVVGGGAEVEHGAVAAMFVAGIVARLPGAVLWCVVRPDLFAPALALAGLTPDRVIYAESRRNTLLAMEEGLRQRGLAGVVGETDGRITLSASRRLHLAAEAAGLCGFLLRRSRNFDDPRLTEPSAATTRWRITAQPSGPPLPHAPAVPGLVRALWRIDLVRCRGGEPASWMVEACDATGHLGMASDISDRPAVADHHAVRHLRA